MLYIGMQMRLRLRLRLRLCERFGAGRNLVALAAVIIQIFLHMIIVIISCQVLLPLFPPLSFKILAFG